MLWLTDFETGYQGAAQRHEMQPVQARRQGCRLVYFNPLTFASIDHGNLIGVIPYAIIMMSTS